MKTETTQITHIHLPPLPDWDDPIAVTRTLSECERRRVNLLAETMANEVLSAKCAGQLTRLGLCDAELTGVHARRLEELRGLDKNMGDFAWHTQHLDDLESFLVPDLLIKGVILEPDGGTPREFQLS